jgi:hypothetical protein
VTEQTGALARVVHDFPDHRTLAQALRERVDAAVLQLRDERGDVHAVEDVFPLVRWGQATAEKLNDYARAFAGAAGHLTGYVSDELVEAVGETDGIPARNLVVPDTDGTDIHLTAQTSNVYMIDTDNVLSAAVADLVRDTDMAGELAAVLVKLYSVAVPVPEAAEQEVYDEAEELLARFLLAAIERARELGKLDLQVSKVRAFAKAVARRDTSLAATVSTSVRSTRKFGGVAVKRVTPDKKPPKEKSA